MDFQYPLRARKPGEAPDSGTFRFLGFTHYGGRTRRGCWAVKRKTAPDRFSRSMVAVKQWCWRNRHRPVREQWKVLCQKMRGHYGYYGITGKSAALRRFRFKVLRTWRNLAQPAIRSSKHPVGAVGEVRGAVSASSSSCTLASHYVANPCHEEPDA